MPFHIHRRNWRLAVGIQLAGVDYPADRSRPTRSIGDRRVAVLDAFVNGHFTRRQLLLDHNFSGKVEYHHQTNRLRRH